MAFLVVLTSAFPAGNAATFGAPTADYLRRASKYFPCEVRGVRSAANLLAEMTLTRRAGAAAVWLADPAGKAFSSEQFAAQIGRLRDSGVRRLMVGIGPADGWSEAARAQADLRFTLGPMTLPHQLARLVVAEQIYRAATILAGHPYHLGH